MRIAIIGAGLSGITLAENLKDVADIVIFEKSRGIGGRITTRFSKPFYFDHGAQYFTAKTAEFQEFLKSPISEGFVKEWNLDCCEIDLKAKKLQKIVKKSYYVGSPKMNELCKYFARKFPENVVIKLKTRVVKISKNFGKWQIFDENNNYHDEFDLVISTIPPQQAIEIIPPQFKYFEDIKNYQMIGCYSLMLALKEKPDIKWNAVSAKNSKINWISFDSSKPNRILGKDEDGNEHYCFLINSNNEWAQKHIEDDQEFVENEMILEAQKIMKFSPENVVFSNLHKWRYANIGEQKGDKSLYDEKNKIAVCGDWLIQAKVESAFLSATDLVKKLKNL